MKLTLTLGSLVWAAVLFSISPLRTQADLIRLQGDLTIEAQTIEDRGPHYRVTTRQGTYDIEKVRVVKIEPGPGPRELYEQEKTRHADTAAGHFEMAQWCAYQRLASERLFHLQRVLELDPEHSAARKDLGYFKKDGVWVKRKAPNAPTDEEIALSRRARHEEAEIRDRVSGWFVKIKAIEQGRLHPHRNDAKRTQFAEGSRMILAIRDPLAIGALAEVLSAGDVTTRRLLANALSAFTQDEAVMNLLAMALFDTSREVRQIAADHLTQRHDERVLSSLRPALFSERDETIRNSATALGRLKAKAAVPDLIAVLSTEVVAPVRVSQPVYLDNLIYIFGRPTPYPSGAEILIYRPPYVGVLGPGALMGTIDRYEMATVSVHRTEVQDALIAITGQNLGFDRAAWWAWWRANR